MPFKRRVFFSIQHPDRLDERRRALQEQIIARVEQMGLQPEIFFFAGTAAALGWSFQSAVDVMRRCVGAVVLAFSRWSVTDGGGPDQFLPSEYAHIEGGIAVAIARHR